MESTLIIFLALLGGLSCPEVLFGGGWFFNSLLVPLQLLGFYQCEVKVTVCFECSEKS